MRRTYQPNKRQYKKAHGFRARMRSANGIVIKNRRAQGRAVLAR